MLIAFIFAAAEFPTAQAGRAGDNFCYFFFDGDGKMCWPASQMTRARPSILREYAECLPYP